MGLLTNSINEIRQDVESRFGDTNNYLVVMKKNKVSTNLLLWLVNNLLYILDSNRTFIIQFTPKGIYEKEISNSTKGNYVLIPWNEISDFVIKKGKTGTVIEYDYLGQKIMYKVYYKGVPYKDNQENEKELCSKDWNRVE